MAFACLVAAVVWGRSARYLQKIYQRAEAEFGPDNGATVIARSAFRKEIHATGLYAVLAVASLAVALTDRRSADLLYAFVLVPVVVSFFYGRDFVREARIAEQRAMLERRAEEVLSQEELAPRRWAARLAPDDLPEFPGFEVGRVYQAGMGLMAGDFYDVFRVAPGRLVAVIGDVTGHGIEPSITAFQAKYLLRVFLRQYRDPAQALEELNRQMGSAARVEEFISLVVVVFDTEARTLRFASAGHPAAWLWHEREVQPLRATGPLLLLDPDGSATSPARSRSTPATSCCCTRTGWPRPVTARRCSVRSGSSQFMRRDPGVDADVLCKSLLEAARDFASSPISDDIAILAIRRV